MKKTLVLLLTLAASAVFANELVDSFQARKAEALQRTGVEMAALSALELDGFPIKQIEKFEFFFDSKEFVIKTKNGDVCMGAFKSRKITFDCLNAVGIKTLQATGDSD